jgi:hypothetical protein
VIFILSIDSATVVSFLGLAGSAIGSLCGVLINTKLSNYRVEQLEKKVDKHNNIIERVYELEQKSAVCDNQIKVCDHRIEDLEKIFTFTKN